MVINLFVLAFFKYADFLILNMNRICGTQIEPLGIGLPVGISFFTFQTMSYIIDLYWGRVETEHNYFTYLTYVSMFPQLVAGPIVRFADVDAELHKRSLKREEIEEGILRFMQGLFKKVLVANQIGALWEELRIMPASEISILGAWLGAVCFTLQLYFDFSAYSDMAIGMGKMLGFHFNENFRYPLWAVSVTDFWRRWHISLSGWFRDYVYIPLGGNRKGIPRQLLNMMVVWALTGLWHGAAWNFALWGIYYGVLLALEKFVWGKVLDKLPGFCRHLYTIIIVVFGFVIFTFDDMAVLGAYLTSMFGLAGNPIWGTEILWHLGNNWCILLCAAVLSAPVYPWLKEKGEGIGGKGQIAIGIARLSGYVALFLLATACLVNDTFNPFLYFRF